MIKLPKNEGLNIIPFIDIMLVVLAMVLSISTFIASGKIKVDLPSASSAKPLESKDKITIIIDQNDIFYLNDNQISIDELNSKISITPKDTIVELKSDKEAKFDSFVKILDILKINNHENFSIITEKIQ
ncbi:MULTISPECIES: TonB system transport protein ExbD [Campylobacter]|uniref:Biopolymer transport protein ExbD n=1 Tax=Campylobacter porcelli TaxID=1660073 RepID=A0ABU7M6I3_9BACT|nr:MULTISPECIES: TonB system transport protein ExbD [unclassified Campylobacter]MCR8679382.1 TonB system transport protein ExbD [Campylobacter sp. RM19072]MCR8696512.1 TonB system transport protein ExbD [Campylobacter sp. RM19073]MEE3744928.1 TonB system transport protein ExbD [Campylobacter sp. CX2-4855-23]